MMNKSISRYHFKMPVFAFRSVLRHFNSIRHKLCNINIRALKWLKINRNKCISLISLIEIISNNLGLQKGLNNE